jgi:hypothetical protein
MAQALRPRSLEVAMKVLTLGSFSVLFVGGRGPEQAQDQGFGLSGVWIKGWIRVVEKESSWGEVAPRWVGNFWGQGSQCALSWGSVCLAG